MRAGPEETMSYSISETLYPGKRTPPSSAQKEPQQTPPSTGAVPESEWLGWDGWVSTGCWDSAVRTGPRQFNTEH